LSPEAILSNLFLKEGTPGLEHPAQTGEK